LRGFYRAIIEKLRENGCWFERTAKGDHELWHSPITDRSFTVDRHCMSRHTANAVMKQAGIDHRF
jgi:hypothetical protein